MAWLNMPMMTRKRMTRRDILPGTTFTREREHQNTAANILTKGSMRKLIQDTTTNITQGINIYRQGQFDCQG